MRLYLKIYNSHDGQDQPAYGEVEVSTRRLAWLRKQAREVTRLGASEIRFWSGLEFEFGKGFDWEGGPVDFPDLRTSVNEVIVSKDAFYFEACHKYSEERFSTDWVYFRQVRGLVGVKPWEQEE